MAKFLQISESKIKGFLLVSLLAAVVRFLFLFEIFDNPLFIDLTLDSRSNFLLAQYIFENGSYPPNVYGRAPLYYYFLAGQFHLFGLDLTNVRMVQSVLGALSSGFLFLFAQRVFNPVSGLIAGLAAAFFWTPVYYTAEILDTTLTLFLYSVFLWVFFGSGLRGLLRFFLAGIVFGAATITRPGYLLFIPLLGFFVVYIYWLGRKHIRLFQLAALAVGMAAVLSPIFWHNYKHTGEFAFIYSSGINLYQGNRPEANGKDPTFPRAKPNWYTDKDIDMRADPKFVDNIAGNSFIQVRDAIGHKPTAGEVNSFYNKKAWEFVLNQPWELVKLYAKKFVFFFNGYEYPNNRLLEYLRKFESSVLNNIAFVSSLWLLPFLFLALAAWLISVKLPLGLFHKRRIDQSLYIYFLLCGAATNIVVFVNAKNRLLVTYMALPLLTYFGYRLYKQIRIGLEQRDDRYVWSMAAAVSSVYFILVLLSAFDPLDYKRLGHLNLYRQQLRQYANGGNLANLPQLQGLVDVEARTTKGSREHNFDALTISANLDFLAGKGKQAMQKANYLSRQKVIPQALVPNVYDYLVRAGKTEDANHLLEVGLSSFPTDYRLLYAKGKRDKNPGLLKRAALSAELIYPLNFENYRYLTKLAGIYGELGALTSEPEYIRLSDRYILEADGVRHRRGGHNKQAGD